MADIYLKVVSRLGLFLGAEPVREHSSSLFDFMKMMAIMVEHPSLEVSMPIMYTMSKLYAEWHSKLRDALMMVMGPYIKVGTERLLRYDLFPEDSNEPSVLFSAYDSEDFPERHAMIGNYRKYCKTTVECIAERRPREASEYVIEMFKDFLKSHDVSGASPEGMAVVSSFANGQTLTIGRDALLQELRTSSGFRDKDLWGRSSSSRFRDLEGEGQRTSVRTSMSIYDQRTGSGRG